MTGLAGVGGTYFIAAGTFAAEVDALMLLISAPMSLGFLFLGTRLRFDLWHQGHVSLLCGTQPNSEAGFGHCHGWLCSVTLTLAKMPSCDAVCMHLKQVHVTCMKATRATQFEPATWPHFTLIQAAIL